jgi:predicted MarR family transcription regulator
MHILSVKVAQVDASALYYRGSLNPQRRTIGANMPAGKSRTNVEKLETTTPLGRTERERAFLEFEQALICASEALYRFAGAVFGPTGSRQKLTGQECVILQQLMFTPKPRSVSELSRFSNRDDISNIQYSLRKLSAAGLIEKVPGSTNRDTRYRPTQAGRDLTEVLVSSRRELLIAPSADLPNIEVQLKFASTALALLTGMYDHTSRVLAGRM